MAKEIQIYATGRVKKTSLVNLNVGNVVPRQWESPFESDRKQDPWPASEKELYGTPSYIHSAVPLARTGHPGAPSNCQIVSTSPIEL